MTLLVKFEVPGYAQPKQRTFGNRFITPPETRRYERTVGMIAKASMKGALPLANYLSVEIEVWCAIPQSWSLKKKASALAGRLYPTHCDLDNVCKVFLDGMNEVVYVDDRFVSELKAKRRFACEEKAIVTVRSLVAE